MPNQSFKSVWRSPPAGLLLDANEIHVWLIEAAETAAANLGAYAALLSAAEQARADRFKFAKDRLLFTVAHAALRSILARYTETLPGYLQFDLGGHGKPKLGAPQTESRVAFNLSHSHGVALLAVAHFREVGIDVEFVNADFAFDEVAERFFTAGEVAALRALPAHLRRQAFYKCWTSKEGFLKAKGIGLSGELDEVKICLAASREQARIEANVPGWSLLELNVVADYEGALVYEGARAAIQLYRWESSLLRFSES